MPSRRLPLLLVFLTIVHADSVYLDSSFDPSTRASLQTLADDVWNTVQQMFHSSLPLDLPVDIHFEDGGVPLTQVEHPRNPAAISIRITAGGTHYSQFVFQLGHELGHVMLDPRRSNGLVESICIAVSYEVLDRIGDDLKQAPVLPWLTDYAPNFRAYRRNDQKLALEPLPADVRKMVETRNWSGLRDYLQAHQSEWEPHQPHERAFVLRSAPVDWGQFTGLAGCTTPPPDQRPNFSILPIDATCLAPLSETLCRIGFNCAP